MVEKEEEGDGRVKGKNKGLSLKSNTSVKPHESDAIGQSIMQWAFRERAVTDKEIVDRVREFFEWHFENGAVPTLEKLALALGYTRTTLGNWERGGNGSTLTRQRTIQDAKEILASYDADLAIQGYLNPFLYVFRSKNYFGMKDQVDHTIAPGDPLGEIRTPEEIARRINAEVPDDDDL